MANKNTIKKWITYLKQIGVAAQEPDTKTKEVRYLRPVLSSHLVKFLTTYTDIPEDKIQTALELVLDNNDNKKIDNDRDEQELHGARNTNQSTYPLGSLQPNTQSTNQQNRTPRYGRNSNSNSDIEDADFIDIPSRPGLIRGPSTQSDTHQNNTSNNIPRLGTIGGNTNPPQDNTQRRNHTGGKIKEVLGQTPNAIRKRNNRLKKKGTLAEAFIDNTVRLSENDILKIFTILNVNIEGDQTTPKSQQDQQPKSSQESPHSSTGDFNGVVGVIKKMNNGMRKALWDMLISTRPHTHVLNEVEISKAEVDNVLKFAINKDYYGNLKQKNITLADLQNAWKKAGYPTDTQDIGDILYNMGFDKRGINKVFNAILGDNESDSDSNFDYDDTVSPIVTKLFNYIQKYKMDDEVIGYLRTNYPEITKHDNDTSTTPQNDNDTSTTPQNDNDLMNKVVKGAKTAGDWVKNKFKKSPTYEDVRDIFNNILQEDRSDLDSKIHEVEMVLLGRKRK